MTLIDPELLEAFLEECQEHLILMEECLLALEKDHYDKESLNSFFRGIHSMKGGAGFLGLKNINELSHVMESLLIKIRNDELSLTSEHVEELFKGLDKLKKMINEAAFDEDVSEEVAIIEKLINKEKIENDKKIEQEQTFISKIPIEKSLYDDLLRKEIDLYFVKIFLKKNAYPKEKSFIKYLEELKKIGNIYFSSILEEDVDALGDSLEGEIAFVFLIETILEKKLLLMELEIEEEQILQIDLTRHKHLFNFDKAKNIIKSQLLNKQNVEENSEKNQQETQKKDNMSTKKIELNDDLQIMQNKDMESTVLSAQPDNQNENDKKNNKEKIPSIQTAETIRVKVSQLNKLVDLAGELVLARNQLLRVIDDKLKNVAGVPAVLQSINIIASELQEDIMNTRMQPISLIFNKFSRLIYDLSRNLNKKIDLKIEGEDVELDKTIIELLSDPLNHIIRNSADHGIEHPEERASKGKKSNGTIILKAYHMGGLVNIDIIDDGRGIDTEKVVNKAIDQQLISVEEAKYMPKKEKVKLIFLPGFSTAESVSDVSGRGVGMDVVLTNIKKLGGTIDIDSSINKGTTVHITIPLTLAIVSSLLVQTENEKFAIPQTNIEEIVRVKTEEFEERLAAVQGGDVLKLRGNLLPLLHLADGVGIQRTFIHPETGERLPYTRKTFSSVRLEESSIDKQKRQWEERRIQREPLRILVVRVGLNRLGIIVDDIIGSEEIVVKPIPEYLRELSWYAGATILGDGKVAIILDVLGFSEKNRVFFNEIAKSKQRFESDLEVNESFKNLEKIELLLFNNGTQEQFALPIPLIKRIDEVETKKLEQIGDKNYIDYKGSSMMIIHLEDFLKVQRPEIKLGQKMKLIIPKDNRKLCGIFVNEIIDTKSIVIRLEDNSIQSEGVLGSIIIEGKIVLLIDLNHIIEKTIDQNIVRKKAKKSKHILLVEDTDFYLNIEKKYLTDMGHKVTTARNGKEALDLIDSIQFDAVITDIEMPIMNGFELATNLRKIERYAHLPIIAVTSVVDPASLTKSREIGFTYWIQKLNKNDFQHEISKFI